MGGSSTVHQTNGFSNGPIIVVLMMNEHLPARSQRFHAKYYSKLQNDAV